MCTNNYDLYNLIIQIFIALGTVGAVFWAVFGQRINTHFDSPKLRITSTDYPSTFGKMLGIETLYSHLRVINDRPTKRAINCKVVLINIIKGGVSLPIPGGRDFFWAPANPNQDKVDIFDYKDFDFVYIKKGDTYFTPHLTNGILQYEDFIKADTKVIFEIKVKADNFVNVKTQRFEVYWNSSWSDDYNMLTISEP